MKKGCGGCNQQGCRGGALPVLGNAHRCGLDVRHRVTGFNIYTAGLVLLQAYSFYFSISLLRNGDIYFVSL